MSNGIPASEVRPHVEVRPLMSVTAAEPTGFLRATWQHWKKIAHAVGVVQTRILMVAFYFVCVLPLGLIMRMSGDKLHLRPPKGTNWTPHAHEEPGLESARRQF